ncbi:MAG: ABC transporter permease [Dehalococcoidia bacterium]|nr:ABC transporter permease [Dehalococcoidia bacterium]
MAQEQAITLGPLASAPHDTWPVRLRRTAAHKPVGAVAAVLLLFVAVVSVLAPITAPYDPLELAVGPTVSAPSMQHWFGTDELGRDLLSRIIWGGQISITVSLVSVFIGKGIGALLGIMSAFYQGTMIDKAIQWLTDVLLALPVLVMAMAVVAVLGASMINVIGAISFTLIPSGVRVIRSQALSVMRNQYIDGARAVGAGDWRLMLLHVMPNCFAPFIIIISGSLGTAILAESSLSFLGLGVPPPFPTWGGMLSGGGRTYMTTAIWMAFAPGLVITFVILGFNVLGDALRDTLDPRLRQ